MSVAAPFVWRCLSGSAVAPFPHPPHRTGRADFLHPALGQDLTPSSTARRAQAGSGVRARSARRGATWIAPASPDLVLGAQPPAQPHRRVGVERPISLADSAYRKVFAHPRSVRFTSPTSVVVSCHVPDRLGQRVDLLDRALNAFLRRPVADTGLLRSSPNTSARTCSPGIELALRHFADARKDTGPPNPYRNRR